MTYDFTDSAYDELIKDADRDNRVGDHLWMVTKSVHDTWPSGDPRIKVTGVLTTAGNAKADLTISPPPPPDVVKAQKDSWDQGKKRAIAATVTMYRQLAEHYQTVPEKLSEGDVFAVKTTKTRVDADGKGGFIRVVAFLAKDRLDKTRAAAAANEPPF